MIKVGSIVELKGILPSKFNIINNLGVVQAIKNDEEYPLMIALYRTNDGKIEDDLFPFLMSEVVLTNLPMYKELQEKRKEIMARKQKNLKEVYKC